MKFFAQDIPDEPGVYVFRNAEGTVIYVGKAKSLRRRMSHYFRPSSKTRADPKLRALIHSIAAFEYFPVRSESEALVLEDRLVKQYDPRYNIDLRDDKRYFHLVVDPREAWPRLHLVRLRKEDGRLYFGPFPSASTLRLLVAWLSRHFRLRTCKEPSPDAETARHCMARSLGQCPCPCLGMVSPEEYQKGVDGVVAVFRGQYRPVVAAMAEEMQAAAANLEFEKAAGLRDLMERLKEYADPARRSFRNWSLETARHRLDPAPGLEELRQVLEMAAPAQYIECLDMSHLMGTFAVGSVVCFRQGRPSPRDYRRFRIRSEEAGDDTARMAEVISRRYGRLAREGQPLPDLVVVDGGMPQLNAALATLRSLGLEALPTIALAKRQEEIYLPGQRLPLTLPLDHPGLKLLRAIRDEAHRFAVSYNRELRLRRISESLLDDVPGIGPKRRLELLKGFGSVARLRQATAAEIAAKVPGLGPELSAAIVDFLKTR